MFLPCLKHIAVAFVIKPLLHVCLHCKLFPLSVHVSQYPFGPASTGIVFGLHSIIAVLVVAVVIVVVVV